MKKLLFTFLIPFFICANVLADSESDLHLIFVNGVAEKSLEPNMVLVQLESWSKAATANKAQELQANQFAKLKASIEKFKIKKEDIQTQGFSVYPEYTYDQKNQTNKITGYRVSHSIQITYRKVEEAGVFLDSIVTSKSDTNGVNVQSVSWDYDNKASAESSVLTDAVKNARSKAEELATAAGVSITAVHKIQHTSYAPPVARPMYEAKSMRASLDSAAAPTELASGQIKVRVEVQMEFEIQTN